MSKVISLWAKGSADLAPIDPGVNQIALRRLYGYSPTAKAMLDYFATYKRAMGVTSVESLIANVEGELDRRDVITVLQKLDQAGCGKFVIGRRGQKSRFQWRVPMMDVGRAAAARGDGADPEQAIDGSEPVRGGLSWLDHEYRLRPDLIVKLSLPQDLTALEAARLSDFVKTLSFGPGPADA